LEQAGIVTFTSVHPTWQRTRPNDENDQHHGWAFYDSSSQIPLKNGNGYGAFVVDGCEPDPNHDSAEVQFIRDLYEKSNDQWMKFTVPVLWDKKTQTIVNNESSEIVRIFNSKDFEALLGDKSANKTMFSSHDFYPLGKQAAIDALNDWIYTDINDGVYKCGFAKSQQAYEEAIEHLYRGLDRVESIFSQSRFLLGNQLEDITEADIRLFMTLIRFDEVYVVYFKCNQKILKYDYPAIQNYLRDLYQLPHMQECIRMDHIKIHYFS
jgi:putative glutathione S-transferase